MTDQQVNHKPPRADVLRRISVRFTLWMRNAEERPNVSSDDMLVNPDAMTKYLHEHVTTEEVEQLTRLDAALLRIESEMFRHLRGRGVDPANVSATLPENEPLITDKGLAERLATVRDASIAAISMMMLSIDKVPDKQKRDQLRAQATAELAQKDKTT